MSRESFYNTPPKPRSITYSDRKLGYEDLIYDPREVVDENQHLQLEGFLPSWIYQFNIFGEVRNYIRDSISSGLLTLNLRQARQSRGVAIFSFTLDTHRIDTFDPGRHDPNLPTMSYHDAQSVLAHQPSYRRLSTHLHDRRTFPVYIQPNSELTLAEIQVLALLQLGQPSFVSSVLYEEIAADLAAKQKELELLQQPVLDPSSLVGPDGVGW